MYAVRGDGCPGHTEAIVAAIDVVGGDGFKALVATAVGTDG